MNAFASNGAGGAVRPRATRDISTVARSMAQILVGQKVDLGDEADVERLIRQFHPKDMFDEVDRLVEVCPDMARAIVSERGEIS